MLTQPILQYVPGFGPLQGRAITGGYVYDGPGGGDGLYFFGDFVAPRLFTARIVDGEATEFTNRNDQLIFTGGDLGAAELISFSVDGSGRLYTLELDGEIHRLTPRRRRGTAVISCSAAMAPTSCSAAPARICSTAATARDRLSGGLGNDRLIGGRGTMNCPAARRRSVRVRRWRRGRHDHGLRPALDRIGLADGISMSASRVADLDRDGVPDLTVSFNGGGSIALLGVADVNMVQFVLV